MQIKNAFDKMQIKNAFDRPTAFLHQLLNFFHLKLLLIQRYFSNYIQKLYNKITLQNQIFTDTDLSQITEKKMVNVLFNTVPFKEIITCLSLNLGVFLKGNYRKREEHVRIPENYDLLKKKSIKIHQITKIKKIEFLNLKDE